MKTEWIDYRFEGKRYRGYAACDTQTNTKKPVVIVAHAWRGLDNFARKKAEYLAEMGYLGFAADLYGDALHVETNEEASALMLPLFIDRKTLRSRIVAAYDCASNHPLANPDKMSAIGFCFGGLTVIELLRSGVKLKGIVSFHGLLGNTLGESVAVSAPSAPNLHGSILLLHGYQDPLVSKEDVQNIQKEFSEAKLDWQMHIYGEASHAFTNPMAAEPELGLLYHPKTERRSLQTMKNYLEEIFE